MLHSPHHYEAAQLTEPITGIKICCPNLLCFLSQETCGFHFHQSLLFFSFYLLNYLQLQLQIRSQVLHRVFLHPPFFHHQLSFSCLLFLLILCFVSRSLISPPLVPLPLPLSNGLGFQLYAGLKACAKLYIPTHRLHRVPCCPHNEIIKGPVECIPDSNRDHPWNFIQYY